MNCPSCQSPNTFRITAGEPRWMCRTCREVSTEHVPVPPVVPVKPFPVGPALAIALTLIVFIAAGCSYGSGPDNARTRCENEAPYHPYTLEDCERAYPNLPSLLWWK